MGAPRRARGEVGHFLRAPLSLSAFLRHKKTGVHQGPHMVEARCRIDVQQPGKLLVGARMVQAHSENPLAKGRTQARPLAVYVAPVLLPPLLGMRRLPAEVQGPDPLGHALPWLSGLDILALCAFLDSNAAHARRR